jgi:hypothetical protein
MRRTTLFYAVTLAVMQVPQVARADGVLPSVATPVQREQAQSRFRRGKELANKQRYEEAATEFRASHEIVTSPNTRLELARCMRMMGRLVAAYAEFGRAAVEAKELEAEDNRYLRAKEAAVAERAEIEPKLGFVTLAIENPSEGTRVIVASEEIRRPAWGEPTPVAAGSADIVVETPAHQPVRRTVSLAPGEKTSLSIDAQSGEPEGGPPPPPPVAAPVPEPKNLAALRPWAYVGAGVGAAGLVSFALFGALAKSDYDDLQTACGGGPCPAGKQDEIASGKTKQTIANVSLVFGILGAAAGATLFVLSMPKDAPVSSVSLVVSPAGIGVGGGLR